MPKITYQKPALTLEQQLDQKLIPRGLVIPDRARALKWLRRIGYYRLSGYLYPFRVSPTDDRFRPGSNIELAISTYKFDCQLRLLLLQAIDRVEIAIRASVTYHMGHALGPFGYMDQNNYASTFNFQRFLQTLLDDENKSREVFLWHYRNKYSDPFLPIWMATEIISFGTLSRMTKNLLDKSVVRAVARDFGLSQTQLISWMGSIQYIRNVCAHHGRLWNRTISLKPELLNNWKLQQVPRDRIYVVLLMMEKLLSEIAPESHWKDRVKIHVLRHPDIPCAPMGFPANWLSLRPWSLL